MVKPLPTNCYTIRGLELNMAAQSASYLLRIPQSSASQAVDFSHFDLDVLVHQRRKRVIRPQKQIVTAILDACRTPSVQHWIMVKARLGYDTFWKHMNELVSMGMMNTSNDGNKTMYSINEKGLNLLQELQEQCNISEN
jgi:predicted transcriptional regulator